MKLLLYFLGAAGIFILFTAESGHFNGSPGGKTGSPGDGGATCTQCHTGTATTIEGWITSNIPASGYSPGETYTITATGTHEGCMRFGFEATSENAAGSKVGSLIITNDTETKLTNLNHAVTHKSTGTTPSGNSKTWTFNWIAPPISTGAVTFYAAFNAANGNGNNFGDVIYKSMMTVVEATPPLPALTVNIAGMNPHIGEKFEARLVNKYDLQEKERLVIDPITDPDFNIVFSSFEPGGNYWIDFYADHNNNGYYDGIPTDHAWRLTANNVGDNTTLNFVHNTNFSEIHWKHLYALEFNGMTPHIGEKLEVRLIDQLTMSEAGRINVGAVPSAEFTATLPFIETGNNYFVDFYADHNANGIYDTPPTDHAWRIELLNTEGDEDDSFTHNTGFTDIGWIYKFSLNTSQMNPHLGELFELRIVNQSTLEEVSRMRLDSIVLADFFAITTGIGLNGNYFIDFYADHNGNGVYDPPPTDHAWRLDLNNVAGDTELSFVHNTNFTDIQWPTTSVTESIYGQIVQVYPNPVRENLNISFDQLVNSNISTIGLYNSMGSLYGEYLIESFDNNFQFDMSNLESGLYYMIMELNNGEKIYKTVIKL